MTKFFGEHVQEAFRVLTPHFQRRQSFIAPNGIGKVESLIYPVLVIHDFLQESVAKQLTRLLDKIPLDPKCSDLYNFAQSKDLKSYPFELVSQLVNRLQDSSFLENIENLGDYVHLSTTDIDISVQKYECGDYLLCHDDRLDSRRFAFVLYLVDEDWNHDGELEFFLTDHLGQPQKSNEYQQRIVPKWNTFIVFEVTMMSHHQVREILGNRTRWSISGWFNDDHQPFEEPVKRAKLESTILKQNRIEYDSKSHTLVGSDCFDQTFISQVCQSCSNLDDFTQFGDNSGLVLKPIPEPDWMKQLLHPTFLAQLNNLIAPDIVLEGMMRPVLKQIPSYFKLEDRLLEANSIRLYIFVNGACYLCLGVESVQRLPPSSWTSKNQNMIVIEIDFFKRAHGQ